jgi:hypothetical protein
LTGKLTNSQEEIFTKKIINQNFMIKSETIYYVQTCLFPSSFCPKNIGLYVAQVEDESAGFCPVRWGSDTLQNMKKKNNLILWANFGKESVFCEHHCMYF